MLYHPEKSSIPLGEGGKLELQKEILPAIEVKNHVIWVNPDFKKLPLNLPTASDLEKAQNRGEKISTKIGVFLTPASLVAGNRKIEINSGHTRSGILGRVIFEDNQKNIYRDVDIKGVGYSYYEESKKKFEVGPTVATSNKIFGILTAEDAFYDRDMAEKFFAAGIRVCRPIAIVALEEIVDLKGQKIPVEVSAEKLKKEILATEKGMPVLEIRAFRTKARLSDIFQQNAAYISDEEYKKYFEKKQLILEDARQLLAQELKKNLVDFNWGEYFKWLAQAVGKNIGLMHKNGWCHRYLLGGHNITLDGRLVDFDSIINKGEKGYNEKQDLEDAKITLLDFFYQAAIILDIIDIEFSDLIKLVEKAYREAKNN